MKYDKIFDSSVSTSETEFIIDYENKTPLTVLFEKEGIVLQADEKGNAVFTNLEGKEIYKDKAECERLFSKIYCSVADNKINVRFPEIKFVDHYPHCDGEYDRWSEVLVGNYYITCPVEE